MCDGLSKVGIRAASIRGLPEDDIIGVVFRPLAIMMPWVREPSINPSPIFVGRLACILVTSGVHVDVYLE